MSDEQETFVQFIDTRPKTIWEWNPFGDPFVVVNLPHEVSWLARLTTRILLKSKWKRVGK